MSRELSCAQPPSLAGRPVMLPVEAWLVHRLEGQFSIQVDSLRRFKEEFCPVRAPRYLAYRTPTDLPAIGLATLSAGGFLPLDPGRAGRTLGRRPGAEATFRWSRANASTPRPTRCPVWV